jgi:hypothetical protein
MAARGSQLSRAVEFFRSGNLDECRVALQLVNEVMGKRLDAERSASGGQAKLFTRKRRARKTAEAAPAPAQEATATA